MSDEEYSYAVTIYLTSVHDKALLQDFFRRSAIKASSDGVVRVFVKYAGFTQLERSRQEIIKKLSSGPKKTIELVPKALGKAARSRALKSLRDEGLIIGEPSGYKNEKLWRLNTSGK